MTPTTANPPTANPTAWQRWGKRVRGWLLELALVALVVMAVGSLRGGPELPAVAPDFTARTVTGETLRLHDLRGKPTVLYFWATWCSACKLTSPTVAQYARNHPDVHVIGVAVDELETVQEYLRDTPRPFRVVTQDDAMAAAYPVHALPTTVVLDRDGRVAWSRQGVLLPGELNFHVP